MGVDAVDGADDVESNRAEQGGPTSSARGATGRGEAAARASNGEGTSVEAGNVARVRTDDGDEDGDGTRDRTAGDRPGELPDDRARADDRGRPDDRARSDDRGRAEGDPSFVDEGRTSSRHAPGGASLLLERWPLVIAVAGLVLLAAATIDLTVDDAGSQTMILVAAGVLLVVLPLVRDRLAPVSAGASGLRFELSREIADRGAGATARLIDHSAAGLAVAAETYGRVHATKVAGDDLTARAIRARLTDDLVDEASASARVHKYDADEVRQLFRDGSPVVRVLVLGLMLGDSSLTSVDTLRSAISESRSGNEQYQGLVLANRLRHRLTPSARQSLTERIRNDAAIWRSSDRQAQARAFVGDALADASAARFATRDT